MERKGNDVGVKTTCTDLSYLALPHETEVVRISSGAFVYGIVDYVEGCATLAPPLPAIRLLGPTEPSGTSHQLGHLFRRILSLFYSNAHEYHDKYVLG
ncbi:hypothetical protein RB195_000835 [Necator americanus]|uniref:Uncharacterized protein n=1 Tax=Necator americanus TaxID=51031 RepID=A0ABR1DBL1_NECAM